MKRYILCILTLFLFFSCKESSPVSVIKESNDFKYNRLVWKPDGLAMIDWHGRGGDVELRIDGNKVQPFNKKHNDTCILFKYPEVVNSMQLVVDGIPHNIEDRLSISSLLVPTNLQVVHNDKSVEADYIFPPGGIPTNPSHDEYYFERTRYITWNNPKPCNHWTITWDIPEQYLLHQALVIDYNGNHKISLTQIPARATLELFKYRDKECDDKENYKDRLKPVWVLKDHHANEGATESTVTVTVNLFSPDWKEKGVLEVPVSITKPINP